MKIITLGTSAELTLPRMENGYLKDDPIDRSKDPRDARLRSSIAIETYLGDYVVIDPTSDFWEQIEKAGIADKVKYLLVTHTHKDRVEGIFKRYSPFLTFALKAHWKFLQSCLVPEDKRKEISKSVINLHDLRIYPFPVYHGDPKTMVCGFRIEDKKGASFVYVPEVKNVPGVSKKFLQDADVLVMDGRQWDYHNDWHASMIQQLRWVSMDYKPKKLYFINVGHETAPHKQLVKMVKEYYDGGNVLYDGQVLTIKEEKTYTMEDLIKPKEDLKELTDQKLLFLHSILHSWYERLIQKDASVNWSKEEVISKHREMVEEMTKRGLIHHTEDSLDRDTFNDYRVSTDNKRKQLIEEVLNTSTDVVAEDYISVSVKSLNTGEEAIDIVIKQDSPNPLLEFYITKAFAEEYRDKLNFIYSTLGADESYVPLFDLSIQPRKAFSPVMLTKDLDNYEYGKFFATPTPAATDNMERLMGWVDKHITAGLVIEPVMDGVRMVAGVHDGKPFAWVKNKDKDVIEGMPTIAAAFKALELDNVIFDGMLVELDVNEHVKALDGDVINYIEKGVDGKLKFYAHDCIWYNGRDLHNEPLKNRLTFLSQALKIKTDDIELVRGIICSTPQQVREAIERSFGQWGIVGVVAKELLSKYYYNNETETWAFFSPMNPKALDAGSGGALVDNEKDPDIQDETDPQAGTHGSN